MEEHPIGKRFKSDSGGATATLLSADSPPQYYERQVVKAPTEEALSTSVVIPFYNRDEMVFECVESVVLTTPTSWNCEIVLVDDGSKDAEVLTRLQETYYSVVGVRLPENMGVSVARNRGNAIATGDIIIDLDSDDLVLDGAIRSVVDTIEGGADYVYGDIVKRGDKDTTVTRPEWKPNLLLSRGCFVTGMKAYRRVLWEKVGGFDEDLRSAVDLDFALRCEEVGAVFERVPEPLAVYREHAGQISQERREEQKDNAQQVLSSARSRREQA